MKIFSSFFLNVGKKFCFGYGSVDSQGTNASCCTVQELISRVVDNALHIFDT